ncbi:MAG: glucan biosynthesis protein G, partial [Rhizobiales bacterium]|nr:glucan biosynthesis protein G [Hyphomicrobiales bacterium]
MSAVSAVILARPGRSLAEPFEIAFGPGEPFSPDYVRELAAKLARRSFVPPASVPDAWTKLDYDQYRQIQFRPEASLWRGTASPFEAQLFAPGFYFREGVSISLVEDGVQRRLKFDRDAFKFAKRVPQLPDGDGLNYSGFRVHSAINTPDRREEFAVFQGASYFRGV